MQAPETYLRPSTAAALYGIAAKTIYNWIYSGKLKGYKAGDSRHGRVWVKEAELRAMFK